MGDLDQLYQELILDHARRRVGSGLAPAEGLSADHHERNPVCGDEITLRVRVDGDRIRDVSWEGEGCSISQASASMLSQLVTERAPLPRNEASALIDGFRTALRSRGTMELDEDVYEDAAALTGVSKYTARVKCAMLAWVALEAALAALDG
ncbi:Fe-S cluster assembly sulfur transfer protein SufU [Microbacterium luticocti]|uniref:Fe-S cluster assembly sulfur transfer protein SufU n=1 Tax=Microbacterium luticocti TaxID=451764 RepID=UPI0003FA4DA9|nr:SUF system NifU family Fe-S cluster assembly protein [Microbacterium luticocti]